MAHSIPLCPILCSHAPFMPLLPSIYTSPISSYNTSMPLVCVMLSPVLLPCPSHAQICPYAPVYTLHPILCPSYAPHKPTSYHAQQAQPVCKPTVVAPVYTLHPILCPSYAPHKPTSYHAQQAQPVSKPTVVASVLVDLHFTHKGKKHYIAFDNQFNHD